jgi:hypothetical protein
MRDVRGVPPPLSLTSPAPTLLGDLARGLARYARPGDSTITVAIVGEGDETPALGDALARLERHRVAVLHLVASGRSGALAWTAKAPSAWRRIAARAIPRAMVLPTHTGPVKR